MKHKFILIILIISFLSCNEERKNSKMPVDAQATPETIDLYNKLFASLNKGIMLAHQDALAYGHSWYGESERSEVKDMTGDYPPVIGMELGHIEIAAEYNLDSVYFSDMKRFVKETHRRGGITTFSWHGNNIATGGTSWDCKQDTVVRSILPGGTHHKEYLVWLERLADFFLDLKDDNGVFIPIVLRMYHEHTGDWFWWCSQQCTPQEYKQLYTMTSDFLRNEKNVHHLLYAYSSSNVQSVEHYLERYPGDEYVDIIGFDHYLKGGDNPESIAKYKIDFERNIRIVTSYAQESGKLPIIGETGMEGIPNATYFTEIVYPIIANYQNAWILFWRNAWESDKPNHHYLPYPGHLAEEDFKRFVEMPKILMKFEN